MWKSRGGTAAVCRRRLLLVARQVRGSRNSPNGAARARVKNLDVLRRRLSFSLSVAAKSRPGATASPLTFIIRL